MRLKLIKNELDYERALKDIEALMEMDNPTADQEDELEVLATLIELYEDEVHPVELPSPVEAIRFRMEQQGLKQADLVPFIGSKGKVSEVLGGKRTLSLNMIRRLHEGLGIPAEVLLQEKDAEIPPVMDIDWSKFPINEMLKRNWFEGFNGTLRQAKENAERLIGKFAKQAGMEIQRPVFSRQSMRNNSCDEYALLAWRIRVCGLAKKEKTARFDHGTVNEAFARELIKLSYFEKGPLLAREFLAKNGIHLIVEEHLPKTRLDGAALTLSSGNPLIALTIRYDRIDNFWFTLAHELAHIALHLDTGEDDAFFDNLDTEAVSELESEADRWAQEVLVPSKEWKIAGLDRDSTVGKIRAFSQELRIHPAIPAGRLRKETNDYTLHSSLLGNRKIKRMFGI